MSRAVRRLAGIALFLVSASLPATEIEQTLAIGGELLWFDYREFDENDVLLDKETGPLPGFAANAGSASKTATFQLRAVVPVVCRLDYTPLLGPDGSLTVEEFCNEPRGYRVYVSHPAGASSSRVSPSGSAGMVAPPYSNTRPAAAAPAGWDT